MADAPKDGYLYGFDLANNSLLYVNNSLLYKVPVTRVEDVKEAFSPGEAVHFFARAERPADARTEDMV
jgi:alcohol dehydrogenase (cytochrome c)